MNLYYKTALWRLVLRRSHAIGRSRWTVVTVATHIRWRSEGTRSGVVWYCRV